MGDAAPPKSELYDFSDPKGLRNLFGPIRLYQLYAFDFKTFVGQGIPNDQYEIWLYDTTMLTITRITTATGSGRDSGFTSLGEYGTKIAFVSDADLLGQGIPDDKLEIWLYSLAKGQVYLPIVLKQSP